MVVFLGFAGNTDIVSDLLYPADLTLLLTYFSPYFQMVLPPWGRAQAEGLVVQVCITMTNQKSGAPNCHTFYMESSQLAILSSEGPRHLRTVSPGRAGYLY